MNVQLSRHGQEYFEQISSQRRHKLTRDEAMALISRCNGIETPIFMECLQSMAGLDLITPMDRIHFYTMVEFDEELEAGYTVLSTEASGNWLRACECLAPDYGTLHESGGIYFDRNLDWLWYTSLSKMIETSAFFCQILGPSAEHRLMAEVPSPSLNSALRQFGIECDPDATDVSRAVCEYLDGVIVFYNPSCIENSGMAGFDFYSHSTESIDRLKRSVDGIVIYADE